MDHSFKDFKRKLCNPRLAEIRIRFCVVDLTGIEEGLINVLIKALENGFSELICI